MIPDTLWLYGIICISSFCLVLSAGFYPVNELWNSPAVITQSRPRWSTAFLANRCSIVFEPLSSCDCDSYMQDVRSHNISAKCFAVFLVVGIFFIPLHCCCCCCYHCYIIPRTNLSSSTKYLSHISSSQHKRNPKQWPSTTSYIKSPPPLHLPPPQQPSTAPNARRSSRMTRALIPVRIHVLAISQMVERGQGQEQEQIRLCVMNP